MALTIADVSSYGNIVVAYGRATKGKRSYRQVIEFDEHKRDNFLSLQKDFLDGTYRTSGYVLKTVSDGRKERDIAKTVLFRDRVAQWMIGAHLVPVLMDRYFSPHSHAALPGRGIHTALAETVAYVNDTEHCKYCLKIDIRKYFPSIDRDVLKTYLRRIIKDRVLADITCSIIDDAPGTGVPIGNLLSQFVANLYLTPFDAWLTLRGCRFVRYMDDVVVFAASKLDLRSLLRDIEWYLDSRLRLKLKPNYQIFSVESRGIDYVGYRVYPDRVMLRKSTFTKLRRTCVDILRNVSSRGYLVQREQSQVCSYLGWLVYCTQDVVDYLYRIYFAPIIKVAKMKLSKKLRKKLWNQNTKSWNSSSQTNQTITTSSRVTITCMS